MMKNWSHFLGAATRLLATLSLATGCQEDNVTGEAHKTPRDNAMQFCLSVDTRGYNAAESSTQINGGFWLIVHEVGGDTLYNAWADYRDNQVMLNAEQAARVTWPDDNSTKFNVVALYTGNILSSYPMHLSLTGDYEIDTPGYWYYDNTVSMVEAPKDPLVAHSIVSREECDGGVVQLNFEHILTAIQTSFLPTDTRYFYMIQAVSLSADNHGAYVLSPEDPALDHWIGASACEALIDDLLDQKYGSGTSEYFRSITTSGGRIGEGGTYMSHYTLYIAEGNTAAASHPLGTADQAKGEYVLLTQPKTDGGPATPLQTFIIPNNVLFDFIYSFYQYSEEDGVYTFADNPQRQVIIEDMPVPMPSYQQNSLINIRCKLSGDIISFSDSDTGAGFIPD